MTPTLFIVPTPIGNLEDITLRAIRILSEVNIIACEDTRVTKKLLNHLEITDKKLISYHNYNEKTVSNKLLDILKNNQNIALVSDAGSPGISDPGYRLINKCIQENIKIEPLPGPTALIPAISASGFPIHQFTFMGFPPQKKGRKTFLNEVINSEKTVILYESVHRIIKLLDELNQLVPEKNLCLAKELTKIYEEFLRGKPIQIKNQLQQSNKVKGEFVLIIDNSQ